MANILRLDRNKDFGTRHPPTEGVHYEQDGLYYDAQGMLAMDSMNDEQKKRVKDVEKERIAREKAARAYDEAMREGVTAGDDGKPVKSKTGPIDPGGAPNRPVAPDPGDPREASTEAAAGHRLSGSGAPNPGSTLTNAQFEHGDLQNQKDEAEEATKKADVASAAAIQGDTPPAGEDTKAADKNDDPEKVDLVAWAKGKEKVLFSQVRAAAKAQYGFVGSDKKAVLDYMVDNNKIKESEVKV